MRLVIQRVSGAAVDVDGSRISEIGPGFMILLGFGREDGEDLPQSKVWDTMLRKVLGLRVFPDEQDRMNLGISEYAGGGEILLVSQFTLYADCRKGRRPSFTDSCPPETAKRLYDRFVEDLESRHPGKVRTGIFGAMMDVSLTNWGPVTILLDSETL